MTKAETGAFNPAKPDAVFDLDGTVFKFTVLEEYIKFLASEQIFESTPAEISVARDRWKAENTEANYREHTALMVTHFVGQIAGQQTLRLNEAADIVAFQQGHRRWDITTNMIAKLQETHNVMAISLMPEWLMPPFTRELGFVAQLGSIYVEHEGMLTGEAHSIDKRKVYAEFREGDVTHLDIAMGDTVGDLTILEAAKRPIAFNPSFTLVGELASMATIVNAQKDLVTVLAPANASGQRMAEMLHCSDAAGVMELVGMNSSD